MNALSNLFFGVTKLAKNLYESGSDFDSEDEDAEGESISTSSIYSSTDDKDSIENINNSSIKNSSSTSSLTGSEISSSKNINIDINKGFPGISLKYSNNGERNTWKECAAEVFSCRVGPSYSWYGKKEPSKTSLYELVAIDWVRTKSRIDHIGSKINFPDEWKNIDTHHEYLPPIFIVNVQVPADDPDNPTSNIGGFFTSVTDGEGYSLVYYYKITQDTINQLINLANGTNLETVQPGLKLMCEFCREAPEMDSDPYSHWRKRMKFAVRCDNLEEFSIPSFVTKYNAKPILVTATGTLIRGNGYIEQEISGYKFKQMAKVGLKSIMAGGFEDMIIQFAFLIESQTDDEMPEVLIGAATLNKPSLFDLPTYDASNFIQSKGKPSDIDDEKSSNIDI